MNQKQKIVIGILIIAVLFGAASLLPIVMPPAQVCFVDGVCQHELQIEQLTRIVPLMVALAVIAGAVIYYLMAERVKSAEHSAKDNAGLVLKLLNTDEKKIVERLVKEKGKCFQSEISRIEGLGKLKSHRVLQRLSDRGVIEIEKHGKTNIVRFKPELEKWLVG